MRARNFWLGAALALFTGCGAGEKAPKTPVQIPVVRTWGDLLEAKPVVDEPLSRWVAQHRNVRIADSGNNGEGRISIRLGIDPGSSRRRGGTLAYCLIESSRAVELSRNGAFSAEFFGPFLLSTTMKNTKDLKAMRQMCSYSNLVEAGRTLFMAVLPHDEADIYRLDVFDDLPDSPASPPSPASSEVPEGTRLLAQAKWTVSNEEEEPWLPFGPSNTEDGEAASQDTEEETLDVTLPRVAMPALPWADGFEPQPLPATLDPAVALPRLFPREPDPALQARARPGILELRLENQIEAENCVLTRWWINEKPWEPPLGEEARCDLARAVRETNQTDFRIHVDPEAWPAREGDTVTVQLLYCPRGWHAFGLEQAHQQMAGPSPAEPPLPVVARLSPRVDFVYRKGRLQPFAR
jgi:hypothetical protein